jgi:hypothetical protein
MDDPVERERWLAHVATCDVLDLEGKHVRLRDLWSDAPCVTTFLRHFGCLFCHQMVADVIAVTPAIVERGGRVLFIGNGSVNQAKRFYGDKGLPRGGCEVLTDPDRASFNAAELERGYGKTFNPSSVKAYKGARVNGHGITGLFGDLTQLGGLLVTKPPSRFVFLHRSKFAGDHPNMADVLVMMGDPARRGGPESGPRR